MSQRADLNPKQELFAKYYATDREFFGNGVESYLEAYDDSIDRSKPNWYKTACAAASRLLGDVKVCLRINELLEDGGLNDQFVDKQLQMLVTQHADFSAKMKAIAEYNKLKARITARTEATVIADVTSDGKPLIDPSMIAGFTDFMKSSSSDA